MEEGDAKRRDLELRMLEYEEEKEASQKSLAEKDELIKKLQKQIANLEKGLQDDSDLAFQNLNGIAALEAKVAFLSSENLELKSDSEMQR